MKLFYYKHIIIIFIFLLITDTTAQNNIFNITPSLEKAGFGKSAEILEDKQGDLTISDVTSDELKNSFISSDSDEPNFGFTSSVYWIRFTLANPTNQNIISYLELSYPLIDKIEFYTPDGFGNHLVIKTGDHLPFNTREIKHRNFIFRITLDSEIQHTYYLRVETSSSMNLPLTIWSEKALLNKIEIEQLLLGIFFGAVIIMIIYNIFLFIGFRDRSFVYLFLFIASWGFAQLTINGLAFQYLWSGWTWWSDTNLPFFIFAALTGAVQFCRSLLNTKKNIPLLDKILKYEVYVFLAGMLFSLLLDYAISIKLASGFAIAAIFSVGITGLYGARRGNRSAVIFISAWGMFLIGAVLFAVKSFGIIPSNFLTNWSVQIGFFAMMVLLSIAVQDRIEREKKEKHKVQEDLIEALKVSETMLEQKAEERTQEINRINIMLMDRAIELSSINQLTDKVNSSLNLSEILNFACEELVKIFSVSYASVALLDAEGTKLKLAALYSEDEDVKIETKYDINISDIPYLKTVFETKQPLALNIEPDDTQIKHLYPFLQQIDIHSLLIVPIISVKRVTGIISLHVSAKDFVFSKYEIDLARTIAIQVAGSVENAKQFSETEHALDIAERDLEIGRQIQSGFFPESIQQIPGWEISAHFKAARQVAGDFYDVFQLDNSKLIAIVIADVCDKGVGAALFMVLFRSLLRAYSQSRITLANVKAGLKDVIVSTNNYIAQTHSNSNMFASIFFGVLNPESADIYFVNAGHDAPLIIDRYGNIIKRLEPTGPVAGMFPDLNFNIEMLQLNKGDMLFAFTDGTTDASNNKKEFFTEEKLLKLVGSPGSSGFSLLFNLNSALKKHIGLTDQYDDITQIIVRRKLSTDDNIHSISRIALHENLEELRNFIESASINLNLNQDISFALKLSAEEICTNIIVYGYEGMPAGMITVSLECNEEKVILKVSDCGKHFPPGNAEMPDLNANAEDRKTGGLGLYFIKQLMDKVVYTIGDDNSNLLILEKSLSK
ncbi:MAG: 7TM diverse intracellular signaling domain-containing protein [Ignavibacteriaceae bacterium]